LMAAELAGYVRHVERNPARHGCRHRPDTRRKGQRPTGRSRGNRPTQRPGEAVGRDADVQEREEEILRGIPGGSIAA